MPYIIIIIVEPRGLKFLVVLLYLFNLLQYCCTATSIRRV